MLNQYTEQMAPPGQTRIRVPEKTKPPTTGTPRTEPTTRPNAGSTTQRSGLLSLPRRHYSQTYGPSPPPGRKKARSRPVDAMERDQPREPSGHAVQPHVGLGTADPDRDDPGNDLTPLHPVAPDARHRLLEMATHGLDRAPFESTPSDVLDRRQQGFHSLAPPSSRLGKPQLQLMVPTRVSDGATAERALRCR